MAQLDRQQVAARLDTRQQEIEHRREELHRNGDGLTSELADYDQHPADQGTETFEQELDETTLIILEEEEHRVREAKKALDRYERELSEYTTSHVGELPQQVGVNLATLERLVVRRFHHRVLSDKQTTRQITQASPEAQEPPLTRGFSAHCSTCPDLLQSAAV